MPSSHSFVFAGFALTVRLRLANGVFNSSVTNVCNAYKRVAFALRSPNHASCMGYATPSLTMFFRKIDNPLKIALDLERLGRKDNDENYFTNCDPIAGSVTLTLTEPQEIGKLRIAFYGVARCYRKEPGSNGPSCRQVEPWLFYHDLSPPDIDGYLDPGVHTWNFTSTFPAMTDASLVQDEKTKFIVSEECFEHASHPLPPSCKIETDHTSALETKTHIWYAIDTEYTRIGGKMGKLMKANVLELEYRPMATGLVAEPNINTIYTSPILECRSVGLVTSPGVRHKLHGDPGEGLHWRDRMHSKLHRDSTPLHTFQLELMALDQYTIDKPMPLWLRVLHNPDGRSMLSPEQPPPPVYILESTIKYWTWNHVRGTEDWAFAYNPQADVEDPCQWGEIAYTYKTDRAEKNNDDDPSNDVFAPPTIDTSTGMGTDLTKLSGLDYIWRLRPDAVPDFNTYNVSTRQAIEVEVTVMVGGKRFDVSYQRQKYKWEKWLYLKKTACLSLVGGPSERQHRLEGEVVDEKTGDMSWHLIGDACEPYTFEPECE